jgi:hypothetical protein
MLRAPTSTTPAEAGAADEAQAKTGAPLCSADAQAASVSSSDWRLWRPELNGLAVLGERRHELAHRPRETVRPPLARELDALDAAVTLPHASGAAS